MTTLRWSGRGWVLAVALVGGCSASTGADPGIDDEGGSGGGGGDASNDAGGGSAGMFLNDAAPETQPDAACAYVMETGERTPLSLYIMLDRSSSMSGSKWEAAKAGLAAFLEDSSSAGIRVAFNLFPRPPSSVPACDQMAYKAPKVDYGLLPGNAAAITQLLAGETPDGFGTPIYPALGGALLRGVEVAKPGESSAVLLVTDGEPQGPADLCAGVDPEDPQSSANLAAAAAGLNPPVYTYVVGLPGANQAFANLVATAGGGTAILVSSTNVEQEFQKALKAILGKALPCEFNIPTKVEQGEIATNAVNVVYTGGGSSTTIPKTTPDCAGGGWYYDDDLEPTLIILCPSSCEQVKGDLDGKIEIMLGCQTIIK